MAMKHPVTDSNTPFRIDPTTRNIINTSPEKTKLMQYDHNSERFTFEVPRLIENHDMSLCDVIEIHYENTSSGTSVSARKTYRGIQKIEDVALESADAEAITFSWLVPETATMFAGTLKFQLKFICYDNEDAGIVGYKWHTNVNDDMTITAGLSYSEGDINPSTIVNLQSIEIVEIEGGIDIILDGVHYKLYNGSGGAIPTNVETTNNKVTSISSNATHTQYPSARAVRTLFDSISSSSGGTLPDNVETTTNKVTSIDASATDSQYPSAKAVLALFNGIAGGSVPTIQAGETGRILESSLTGYILVPVSNSAVSRYINNTLKTTSITEESTDNQLPSAKAVYALFNEFSASVVKALNTDVEV